MPRTEAQIAGREAELRFCASRRSVCGRRGKWSLAESGLLSQKFSVALASRAHMKCKICITCGKRSACVQRAPGCPQKSFNFIAAESV